MCLTISSPAADHLVSKVVSKDNYSLRDLERQLLNLVNKERRKRGLSLFSADPQVQGVARKHSADMANRDFFSHYNPDGKDPFDRMKSDGLTFRAAAENIAYAQTLEEIHTSLMNSPGHRKNILNPKFGRLGIGIVHCRYGLMVTELFRD
mgnify:CR=1 FL=1